MRIHETDVRDTRTRMTWLELWDSRMLNHWDEDGTNDFDNSGLHVNMFGAALTLPFRNAVQRSPVRTCAKKVSTQGGSHSAQRTVQTGGSARSQTKDAESGRPDVNVQREQLEETDGAGCIWRS